MKQKIQFKRDGLNLVGELTTPDKPDSFDLVILMYGFGGPVTPPNANTLLPDLAKMLGEAGLATLLFDFAGHNGSEGQIEDMTVLNGIADANAALQYVLHEVAGVKRIFLLGHSQGGVIASMLAGYYPDKIAKLVLLAPAATLVDDAKIGECQGNRYDPDQMPEQLEFPGGWKLNSFYFRTARFLNIYEVARNFEGPVLALHGSDDQIVNNYASRHYQAIYKHCERHLIEGSDHGLHINRQEVFDRVGNFLAKED